LTSLSDTSLPIAAFDEKLRAKQLQQMKLRAAGLLILAAIAFGISHYFGPQYPWLGWVQAFSEAAMVGGLADWFAVTALFRHPLGIPIPHTAIIGRQKDRIGRIIGNFVQHHFLARDAVSAKLRGMRIAERGAEWLSRPENSQRIAVQLAGGIARTLEAMPDDKIRDLIQQGAMKPVIDETLPLERAAEGLRLIENRQVFGKVVVTP